MRPVDAGPLLFSAWQDVMLQRRHCRTKDWPYSQADLIYVRMLICFEFFLQDGAIWVSEGHMLSGRARFQLLGMKADELRLSS